MRKKIILLIFLILSVTLVLLNFNEKQNDNAIHLKFATWGSESEINIIKPIIKEFELQNSDIKIDLMHIPQNYFQKIHLLYASNTAPDVIFINNQYLPIYANAGVLEDLSNYKQYFHIEDFYETSVKSLQWNDRTYAIPRDISNLVVFYNKSLFDKHSIPYPENGWTYDEFLQTAINLTDKKTFGISFDEEPISYLPYLKLYGGWNNNDTKNYFKEDILSKKPNKKGIEEYSDLRFKYHIAPLKKDIGSATNAQLFLQQKIGMYVSGRWMVPKFRQDANFDWDVVEFPILKKEKNKSSVLTDSSGWAISKSSKHKKEAIRFIKYLSSEESLQKFCLSGLIVPARIKTASSKCFNDNKKPLNYQAFLNAAQNSSPTPVTINYREILDDLKIKTERIFNK